MNKSKGLPYAGIETRVTQMWPFLAPCHDSTFVIKLWSFISLVLHTKAWKTHKHRSTADECTPMIDQWTKFPFAVFSIGVYIYCNEYFLPNASTLSPHPPAAGWRAVWPGDELHHPGVWEHRVHGGAPRPVWAHLPGRGVEHLHGHPEEEHPKPPGLHGHGPHPAGAAASCLHRQHDRR